MSNLPEPHTVQLLEFRLSGYLGALSVLLTECSNRPSALSQKRNGDNFEAVRLRKEITSLPHCSKPSESQEFGHLGGPIRCYHQQIMMSWELISPSWDSISCVASASCHFIPTVARSTTLPISIMSAVSFRSPDEETWRRPVVQLEPIVRWRTHNRRKYCPVSTSPCLRYRSGLSCGCWATQI